MESLSGLPGGELLARVRRLIQAGNALEADLIAHLGEVDARRLYLEEGCPSMFSYCQRVLHFAEGVAYKRIQAARAARSHPQVLEALRSGELHLTAIGLLAAKLTPANCAELIAAARHRSADEVKRLLADREPKPAVPTFVRRIPVVAVSAATSTVQADLPERPAVPVQAMVPTPPPLSKRPEPLGAERFRIQFMADGQTHAQVEELRALMRHQVPDDDVGKIIARAISVLLAQVRKQKFGDTAVPRARRSPSETPSRHIPAAIRRAVSQRDGERCTFISAGGRRCESREFLEFDHADAWTWTRTHSIEGITLRCRAHNQLRARRDFGEAHMARFRTSSSPTGFESSSSP
jgi:hypothetical protein